MNYTDAIALLKNDHAELRTVMQNIEHSLTDMDKLEELFSSFKKIYALHDKAETDIFYEALEEQAPLRLLVRKGYQAHHVVDVGILELRLVPFASESWGPKFLVMKDSILTHIAEEENILFPQAEALLGRERLLRLGEEITRTREGKTVTSAS